MCMELSADSKESAGAPEHEIEVTPEMIEAGIETHDLMDAYDFSCDPSGWIRLIYRNMEKMRLKGIRCEDRKHLLL
jgi:hypothetical protein